MSSEKSTHSAEITAEVRKTPEEKEPKLDRLERRVLLVKNFYREINLIRADLSTGEVGSKLEALWDNLLMKFPEKIRDGFSEFFTENKRFEDLRSECNQTEDEEKRKVLWSEITESWEKTSEARNDTDIIFLLEIRKIVDRLLNKYQAVRVLENKNLKDVVAELDTKNIFLPPEAILEVRFNTFDVCIFLKKEDYHLSGENSRGGHLPNSPIIFVHSDSDDPEGFYHHESVHNFLDGAEGFLPFSPEIWKYLMENSIKSYLEIERNDETKWFLGISERSFQKQDAKSILDGLHNEILAALEMFENRSFGTQGREEDEEVFIQELLGRSGEKLADQKFFKIFDLGTAQNQAVQVVEIVESFLAKTNDAFLREYLGKILEEFPKMFSVMANQIQSALEIGRRLGSEADDFAHFSFVLLKPSQFGMVETLLKKRYCETEVERVKKVFEATNIKRFSLEELIKLKETMEEDPDSFETDDLRKIIEQFCLIKLDTFGATLLESLEELRTFLEVMEKIEKFAEARGLKTEVFKKEKADAVEDKYFYWKMIEATTENKILLEDWSAFTPKEVDFFVPFFISYIAKGFFLEGLSRQLDKTLSMTDVESSIFWQVAKLVGVEEKVRPLIETKIG